MRFRTMAVLGLGLMIGCGAKAPAKPEPKVATTPATPAAPAFEETPMPTVPPRSNEPEGQPTPAPVPSPAAKSGAGGTIGPVITYFGAARADGKVVEPNAVEGGIPVYHTASGSGFILVVEAKPGESGLDVARQVSMHSPTDPNVRPDLEIIASRDLGDGSPEVCDRRKPKIGGIPGIKPLSFANTQKIADAINDLSCRFETFIEAESSCTLDKLGNFAFARSDTKVQFCTIVARSFLFPEGTTDLQVRVKDSAGNPGPIKKMRIVRRPPAAKKK
ncbi:MAG TPA: hypothetical protein VEB21_13700 [Terriglobales bacterium]|nr:hypothetical protein [Terriglobales bacterium]